MACLKSLSILHIMNYLCIKSYNMHIQKERKKNSSFVVHFELDQTGVLFLVTRYTGDYEHVNISSFAVLSIKLWLEEDGDLNRNDPL